MSDITVGNVLVVLLRHIQSPGAIPPLPEGSPKLVPCWILAREVGSVAVAPGHRVLPLVLPVHSCCSSRSRAFFSEHPRQRSAGTFWCGHAPLVLLVRVPCLSSHPRCAGLQLSLGRTVSPLGIA